LIFDQVSQFFSLAIKRRVGTQKSDWDCSRDGHFVAPQDLAKKLSALCKTRGVDMMPNESVPFISNCMSCHVQIGCRLTMNASGKIVKYTKALTTAQDLRNWFTEQNEQKFTPLAPETPSIIKIACFCTRPSISEIEGIPLCKEHFLQLLLTDKFQPMNDHRAIIRKIQSGIQPSMGKLSSKRENEAWLLLFKVLTVNELPDFFMHAPEVLSKLKVGIREQKAETGWT
jgi:hypothetical protein